MSVENNPKAFDLGIVKPMTTPTPHPLAIEAAKTISDKPSLPVFDDADIDVIASIINTTALQPVIQAGEEIAKFATEHRPLCDMRQFSKPKSCTCGLSQAITQWRTLTNPQSDGSPKTATEPPRSL